METYELTQALMSIGSVYHVRRPRVAEVLFTIRGEMMAATPKFELVEGEEGAKVGELVGNFIKTRYDVTVDGATMGTVTFPAVAFKKTLTLTVGDAEYLADGGVFKGNFQCKAKDGTVALELAKELTIRDTFLVKTTDVIPLPVAFFTAVAIHSRFYDVV